MPASTSPLGSSLEIAGTLLQVGNAQSPEAFSFIANVDNFKVPAKSDVVMVTNIGDNWKRRRPTLLDVGIITFAMFWIPKDPSQANDVGILPAASGLRYLWIQRLLRDWQVVYPDGATILLSSTDQYSAYVTAFQITIKTGDVFHADSELSTDGPATLC